MVEIHFYDYWVEVWYKVGDLPANKIFEGHSLRAADLPDVVRQLGHTVTVVDHETA